MRFNYSQVCQELLRDLPQRQKEIIFHRFGLKSGLRETLESIGKRYGITRERVRQIEKEGFLRLKPKTKQYQKIFQDFNKYFEARGGLKKEDILLNELAGENQKSQIYFLLTLGPNFERFGETEVFYSLWTINKNSLLIAKKVIDSFSDKFKEMGKPLSLKELSRGALWEGGECGSSRVGVLSNFKNPVLLSYLEISKKIQRVDEQDLFGLSHWPEINPRGIKDKAYLVFKKEKKPLHFTKVAKLLDGSLVQTVHNELIKDSRFVLVGRGIYALEEWGYHPGQVKNVILKILKEERKPLTKKEILEKVLKQRLVKENTVLLNLSNKKYFLKTSKGYTIKKA